MAILDFNLDPNQIETNSDNIMLNAFRIAVNGSLSIFNMIDGVVDEYEDETGIDLPSSINESYDAIDDFYSPSVPSLSTSPYTHFKCNDDVVATSGGTPTVDGAYTYHTFTSNGDFILGANLNVEVLVVAGGGAGGVEGGGGGAGGVLYQAVRALTAGTLAVVVGTGGIRSETNGPGGGGVDSTFDGLTAGGGGGGGGATSKSGGSGGSGGGAMGQGSGGTPGSATQTSIDGATGYGFDGGDDNAPASEANGGGGGASQVGEKGGTDASNQGGDGGNGQAFSITGSSVTYGGGGGGGATAGTTNATGGTGGGGQGSTSVSQAVAGTDGLGGGGGGGSSSASPNKGQDGGNGVVIIRYLTVDANADIVTDDGTGANDGIAFTDTNDLSVVGKINGAFEFNGTTEYVDLATLFTDISSDVTGSFAFWIDPVDANGRIFSAGDTSGNEHLSIEFKSSSDVIQGFLLVSSATKWRFQTPASSLTPGVYNHVAVVQDGVQIKVYINGINQTLTFLDSGTDEGAWFVDGINLDNMRMGCMNYNGSGNTIFYSGKIDDFRYYQNKALTENEVLAVHNGGTGTEADQPTGSPQNMTLISEPTVAELAPDDARMVMLEEDVDAITLNTDLKAYASNDDGVNWHLGTLSDEGNYDSNKRVLVADFDVSAQTDTNMVYKIETLNTKDLKIHGTALSWS